MDSNDMRERARQLRAKAQTGLDTHSKALLIEAARIWETLADRHEKLGPLLDPWPEEAKDP
jgi:hypothetical protein